MAGITLAQAQTTLNAYLAAEIAVLAGQSYTIAGRSLNRADLGAIQTGLQLWSDRLRDLTHQARGRSRSRTVVTN
jgi:hypothetical protein